MQGDAPGPGRREEDDNVCTGYCRDLASAPSPTLNRLLIDAFATLTRTIPVDANTFGSPSLRTAGVCDGTDGVQWNAWIEWHGGKQMAYAGVNLEGKVYDGWPVARLLERERSDPRLLAAAADVPEPTRVEIIWYRDAWQAGSRLPILERLIGGSPRLLHTLTPDDWRAMLDEAYACLDPARGHRGRARQLVTTTAGNQKVIEVSPHVQARQAFWPRDPSSADGWRTSLDETMTNLRPLHRWAVDQARA